MSHEKNQSLIDTLHDCAKACNHCVTACLDEQDVKMMALCIQLDIDCAALCELTASFVARGSEHTDHLLIVCADLCEVCATECEKHGEHGVQHCRDCAAACRKCAEECRNLTLVPV